MQQDESKTLENTQENPKSEPLSFVWDTIKIIIISLAIIVPIRYYLVQPFFVKGASMEPNLENGDYLLVDELSYRLGEPKRGEVIVFRYPYDTSQFFIKRIIGLPSETVEIRNNTVKIYKDDKAAGTVLQEDYLPSSQKTTGDTTIKLKDDEYFVMGDNRIQSSDSRKWGPLNKKYIVGRAFVRLWPFNELITIREVNYDF